MEWLCRTLARAAAAVLGAGAAVAGVGIYVCLLSGRARELVNKYSAEMFTAHAVTLHAVATVLLIIVLVMLWAALGLRRARRRALLINTTEGSVRLSAPMVSRFVRHVVQGCEGVRSARVEAIADRRKMTVIASVSVGGQTPVSILAGRLQQQVRRRVIEVFGVDLLREVRVEITHVATEEQPRALLPWRGGDGSVGSEAVARDAAPVLASS